MLIILFVITLLGIVILEAPKLAAQKAWKELAAFFIVWTLASAMAAAVFFGADLRGIIKIIEYISLNPAP